MRRFALLAGAALLAVFTPAASLMAQGDCYGCYELPKDSGNWQCVLTHSGFGWINCEQVVGGYCVVSANCSHTRWMSTSKIAADGSVVGNHEDNLRALAAGASGTQAVHVLGCGRVVIKRNYSLVEARRIRRALEKVNL